MGTRNRRELPGLSLFPRSGSRGSLVLGFPRRLLYRAPPSARSSARCERPTSGSLPVETGKGSMLLTSSTARARTQGFSPEPSPPELSTNRSNGVKAVKRSQRSSLEAFDGVRRVRSDYGRGREASSHFVGIVSRTGGAGAFEHLGQALPNRVFVFDQEDGRERRRRLPPTFHTPPRRCSPVRRRSWPWAPRPRSGRLRRSRPERRLCCRRRCRE